MVLSKLIYPLSIRDHIGSWKSSNAGLILPQVIDFSLKETVFQKLKSLTGKTILELFTHIKNICRQQLDSLPNGKLRTPPN